MMSEQEQHDLRGEQAAFAYSAIAQICAIDTEIEGWRVAVVEIMTGCPNWVFWSMDDNPDRYGYEHDGEFWHHKLRQVRNDADLKPGLFDVILPPRQDARTRNY